MNEAIRTLLNNEPQALRALNEVFHLDYNKPYQAFKIDGNTTIKQILKKVENPKGKLILVLNYQSNTAIFSGRYIVGIIDYLEQVDIEFNPHYFHAKKVYSYHMKGDFRNDLKNRDKVPYHIIIAQDKAYLTENKIISDRRYYEPDYSQRFKVSNDDMAIHTYSYKCEPYIDVVKLIETTNNGRIYEHQADSYTKTMDINNIIDKSGYLVDVYRRELKRKAEALKAERDKAAFKATDNSAKLQELNIRIAARKLELIEMLRTADSYIEIADISKKLDYWNYGLANIMESFERMQKGVNEKSYNSIEEFNNHYDRISKMLIENSANH